MEQELKRMILILRDLSIPANMIGILLVICKMKRVTNAKINKSFSKVSVWIHWLLMIAFASLILDTVMYIYN